MAGRDDQRVCLAEIATAHGVRGLVRLRTFTERPEDVTAYGPLTDEQGREVRLQLLGPAKGGVLAAVSGVNDRTQAEALRGKRLYVGRDRLPAPDDAEEYYHADLIGLEARLLDGRRLGTVRAIYNFGAGDMLEVVPVGAGPSLILPFTKAVVPEVDIAAGRLVVAPPPGLVGPGAGEAAP